MTNYEFFEAAAAGDNAKIREILSANQGAVAWTNKHDMRRTALHVAAAAGQVETCQLLIKEGADINAEQWAGGTPLVVAIRSEKANVVEELLKHSPNLSGEGLTGPAPLWTAVHFSSKKIVDLLMDAGADATAASPKPGVSILGSLDKEERGNRVLWLMKGMERQKAAAKNPEPSATRASLKA